MPLNIITGNAQPAEFNKSAGYPRAGELQESRSWNPGVEKSGH